MITPAPALLYKSVAEPAAGTVVAVHCTRKLFTAPTVDATTADAAKPVHAPNVACAVVVGVAKPVVNVLTGACRMVVGSWIRHCATVADDAVQLASGAIAAVSVSL